MPAVLSSIQFDHESLNSLGSEGRDPTEIYPRPRPLGGVYAVLNLREGRIHHTLLDFHVIVTNVIFVGKRCSDS